MFIDIQAGSYEGRVVNYGVTETKNNHLQAFVSFKISAGEAEHTVHWTGVFKGGAAPITAQALVKLGYAGNDLTALGEGISSNALKMDAVFDLVIEHELHEGKKYTKIKYINIPGESGFSNLSQADLVTKTKGFDFGGLFNAARNEVGPVKNHAPQPDQEAPIPF